MGAEQFVTFASGKRMDVAFRRAVKQAEYDHGHEGYTGTIAEKEEVRVFETHDAKNPMPLKDADELAWDTIQNDKPPYVVPNKWDEALAIRVKDEEHDGWIFFGWASS